ncbi:hypothetical protein EAH72_05815 [Pseudomonas caspiana]|nr:hypothetical protein [Pseudomonas caspiana]TPG98420.1 hypothetical protein EAH72_05815 [Pseudomonas caspiana]
MRKTEIIMCVPLNAPTLEPGQQLLVCFELCVVVQQRETKIYQVVFDCKAPKQHEFFGQRTSGFSSAGTSKMLKKILRWLHLYQHLKLNRGLPVGAD